MKIANFNTTYFMWLLVITGILVSIIFLPFASALLIAGVLATLFYPMYQWLSRKVHLGESWGSFVACIAILFLIIIPFIATLGLVTNEIRGGLQYLSENPQIMEEATISLQSIASQIPFVNEGSIGSLLEKSSTLFLNVFQKTYTGISQFFFWLFIMFFSLFYFFIDGKRLVKAVIKLSPLKDHQERMLIREFISISKATLKGTVVIGVIQGTLGGLLFAFTGVPSPITWGVVMIILSIIPVIGSGLVWTPVGIAMLFSGALWQGIVILGFGFGVISVIDNILRPKLVGRDSQMHPLLVLLSTLGGIIFFGIIGFIIGPILVALFLALLSIYEQEFSQQLEEYNGGDL